MSAQADFDPGPLRKQLPLPLQPADWRMTSPPSERLVRVYVWDWVVRTCHWFVALSIFTLAFTGFYIGRPFIIVPGEAGDHFVMGWMRAIHFYAATVFVLTVLVRVYWSFLGSPPARWPNFIPITRRRVRNMGKTLSFYCFIADRFPAVLSHNPLAGLTYSVVVMIYGAMILTGLALYSVSAHIDSFFTNFAFLVPIFGGPQLARWIHHAGMWLLLGFFVHHFYSAILAAHVERNGILESIFTGYKWVNPDDLEWHAEERKTRTEMNDEEERQSGLHKIERKKRPTR